jgi:DNA primase
VGLEFLITTRKLDHEQLLAHNVCYDEGHNCFIFPVGDEYGHPIGRTEYRPNQNPKYMHILNPKRCKPAIYNAHRLREAFYGKPVYITEGIIDALTLESLGFIAISTLSAKMSYGIFNLLRRYTDKLVLVFDADTPGQHAAAKCLKKFGKSGILYNLRLYGAKDPNDFAQQGLLLDLKQQVDKFQEKICQM